LRFTIKFLHTSYPEEVLPALVAKPLHQVTLLLLLVSTRNVKDPFVKCPFQGPLVSNGNTLKSVIHDREMKSCKDISKENRFIPRQDKVVDYFGELFGVLLVLRFPLIGMYCIHGFVLPLLDMVQATVFFAEHR
jgi:hypothetical protein